MQRLEHLDIDEIYLDLDDTLNCFTGSVGHYFGVASSPRDLSWVKPELGYLIYGQLVAAFEAKGDRFPFATNEEFWAGLPETIWSECPLSETANTLICACIQKVGSDNVFIATAPTKCPYSCSGKLKWINQHIVNDRNYFMTPRKWKLSGPRRLLIDDNPELLDKWGSGPTAGPVFRVPKPWNQPDYTPGLEDYAIWDFI